MSINSHIQPRMFLKGFLAAKKGNFHSDSIYVYKKGRDYKTDGTRSENNPSYQGIKNVGSLRNFYGFTKADGTVDNETFEVKLQKEFENPADRILKRLRETQVKSNESVPLYSLMDDEERYKFARYVASMYARSESNREQFKRILHTVSDNFTMTYAEWTRDAPEEKKKRLDEYIDRERPGFDRLTESLSLPLKKRKDFQAEKEGDDSFALSIFRATDLAAPLIYRMKWRIIRSHNPHAFFTGDPPVLWNNLGSPNAEVLFPISSDKVFVSSPHFFMQEVLKFDDNTKFVEAIRDRFARQCTKIYYSAESPEMVDFFNER